MGLKTAFTSVWEAIKRTFNLVLSAITNNPLYKAFIEGLKLVIEGYKKFLHWAGFGETFTGIPNEPTGTALALPGPATTYAADLPMVSSRGGTSSTYSPDYSTRRANINIYAQPTHSAPAIAEETKKRLTRDGEF